MRAAARIQHDDRRNYVKVQCQKLFELYSPFVDSMDTQVSPNLVSLIGNKSMENAYKDYRAGVLQRQSTDHNAPIIDRYLARNIKTLESPAFQVLLATACIIGIVSLWPLHKPRRLNNQPYFEYSPVMESGFSLFPDVNRNFNYS